LDGYLPIDPLGRTMDQMPEQPYVRIRTDSDERIDRRWSRIAEINREIAALSHERDRLSQDVAKLEPAPTDARTQLVRPQY
jgi:hypothetical protein